MGAIASGGTRVLSKNLVQMLRLRESVVDQVAAHEEQELLRRESAYRAGRPPLHVEGKVVILVDDGIATGATMRAAIPRFASCRQSGSSWLPGDRPGMASTHSEVRPTISSLWFAPEEFRGVGQWY